jgi:hypothetical protein
MTDDELKFEMEALGIDSEKAEEFLASVRSEDVMNTVRPEELSMSTQEQLFALQNRFDDEKDWRKRAALAARIISLRLDT